MGLTTHHNTVTSTSLPLKVPNTGALLLKNQNVKTLHAALPHLTSTEGSENSTTVLSLVPFHTTEISTAPTDQNKNASEHTTAMRPMYSKVPNHDHSIGKDKNKGDIGTSRTNTGDTTMLLSTRKYWFRTPTAGSTNVRNDNYQAKFQIKDLTSTAKGATTHKPVDSFLSKAENNDKENSVNIQSVANHSTHVFGLPGISILFNKEDKNQQFSMALTAGSILPNSPPFLPGKVRSNKICLPGLENDYHGMSVITDSSGAFAGSNNEWFGLYGNVKSAMDNVASTSYIQI